MAHDITPGLGPRERDDAYTVFIAADVIKNLDKQVPGKSKLRDMVIRLARSARKARVRINLMMRGNRVVHVPTAAIPTAPSPVASREYHVGRSKGYKRKGGTVLRSKSLTDQRLVTVANLRRRGISIP